jgi:A/G-specific adenine glycosylase
MAFWLVRRDGAVLLRRRPEDGLLGGMMEIPSTRWREEGWQMSEAERSAPISASWRPLPGVVRHTFTHFHLELQVLGGRAQGPAPAGTLWCPVDQLGAHALPSVMKKVVAHALRSSV